MKKLTLSCLLLALCGLAQAQEIGQVLSRTAVYQQVAVPRQTCQTTNTLPAANSGGGAVLGAVVGGLIGNAMGGGDSRGIATMAGVIGGSIVGDRAETERNAPQTLTTCTTQTAMENRLVGYNVVYEYAGKTYNVQLPQDPGSTIALQITPVGMPSTVAPPPATAIVTQPSVVYTQPPVVYAPAPYYRPWPINTSINLGWGWQGSGHPRHWR
jgi:uncharacterized protein YcfJ